MIQTPIEQVTSLIVGTVESVSPSEIWILLETDAPQATALNTGTPTGFPRINGYLIIPNETGALVGVIVWIGIERSAFPKRIGMKDFGLIDLPFPLRKIKLTPLGTLLQKRETKTDEFYYELERGISSFPSVGDSALLPTTKQLKSIIESSGVENQRIVIGTSPLATNAKVMVDPNKIFGRHLAVLGNTGSGKSCSVAGLIRWSIEQAKIKAKQKSKDSVNARFIILDPNGEYSTAFEDMKGEVRRFRVPPIEEGFKKLLLPAWMWNSHEWSALSYASPRVQRPILLRALREMRAGRVLVEPIENQIYSCFQNYKEYLTCRIAQGISSYTGRPASDCGRIISNIADDAEEYISATQGELSDILDQLRSTSEGLANKKHWHRNRNNPEGGYNAFSETDIKRIIDSIDSVLNTLPHGLQPLNISEDAPIPFEVQNLPDHLEGIAHNTPGEQTANFIAWLTMRIRLMLEDQRLGPVINPAEADTILLDQWLAEYIGENNAENGQLAILDLSLVPSDVLHIVIAVIARIIFEAIQRYRRREGYELPTVLVLEEAHTFIQRGSEHEEENPTPTQMCRQTFERIAREGRKYGLGLVLSSQRPSELSATVLAQCNTFLLHRIVNDRDQELVGRLVPDNLGGLLKELPSLPTRQAILLGWASTVPLLVEMNELSPDMRPRSADPEFWKVWIGEEEREINWKEIVNEWQGEKK